MIFGMSTATYTLVHVAISLVAIGSGLVVAAGMLGGQRLEGWTAVFILTTIATSVTGFGFPFDHLLPSHVVGIASLVVLTVAVAARYLFAVEGLWRVVYVVSAMLALYLNVFVLVVQSFLKIGVLHALAPTQTEAPFQLVQLGVLATFVALGITAARRFR